MQSPVDPEATYRTKAGKAHLGYSANLIQVSEDGKNLIKDYQVEQNVYSDEEFFKDSLEVFESLNEDADLTVVSDGAYAGTENLKLADEKSTSFIPTDLPGIPTDPGYKDFIIDEKFSLILCPNDLEPDRTSYNKDSESYYISYRKERCEGCPVYGKCPLKKNKRVVSGLVSKKKILRAEVREWHKDDEVKKLSDYRNGVEAVPSQMRNTYNIDRIPHYGKIRVRQDIGYKVIAYNTKSFFRFKKNKLEAA